MKGYYPNRIIGQFLPPTGTASVLLYVKKSNIDFSNRASGSCEIIQTSE